MNVTKTADQGDDAVDVQKSLEYTERGRKYLAQEKYDEALREFRRALQADRRNPYAHRNLSTCYLHRRQYLHACYHGYIYDQAVDRWKLEVPDRGISLFCLGSAYELAAVDLYRLGLKQAVDLLGKAFACYEQAYAHASQEPAIAQKYEQTRGLLPIFKPIAPPDGYRVRFVYMDPIIREKTWVDVQQVADRLKSRLAAEGGLDVYFGYDMVAGSVGRLGRCSVLEWVDDEAESSPSKKRRNGIFFFIPEKQYGTLIRPEDVLEIREIVAPAYLEIGAPLHTVTYIRVRDPREGELWVMILDPSIVDEQALGLMLDYWDELENEASKIEVAECYFCEGRGWHPCRRCDGTGYDYGPCESCKGKGYTVCIRCEGLGVTPPDLDSIPGAVISPAFKEHVRRLRAEGKLPNPPSPPSGWRGGC